MKIIDRSALVIIQTIFLLFIMGGVVGLAGCPEQGVKVQPAVDSRLQQAYAAKDELINAKKALNDLYAAELSRRKTKPKTAPFITDATYDAVWAIAVTATGQADQAIALAHVPPGTPGAESPTIDSLILDVRSKTKTISAASGALVH